MEKPNLPDDKSSFWWKVKFSRRQVKFFRRISWFFDMKSDDKSNFRDDKSSFDEKKNKFSRRQVKFLRKRSNCRVVSCRVLSCQGSGVQKRETFVKTRGRMTKNMKHSSKPGVGWPKTWNVRQNQGSDDQKRETFVITRGAVLGEFCEAGCGARGICEKLRGWSLQITNHQPPTTETCTYSTPIEAAVPSNTPFRARGTVPDFSCRELLFLL